MLITENQLRTIIRKQLLKENKDIKAGDNLTWAKTGRSLTVLTNPVYDTVSKDYLVLCVWDGDDNPNISYIKKYGKKAPADAWDQTVNKFNDIYRPTAEGSEKKRKSGFKDTLLSKDWLSKNGNSSITDKQITQYKNKWRRVAVVNIKYLQTNKEFKKETYQGGTLEDLALDTVVPAVAAVGELLAVVATATIAGAPLGVAFKAVSDSANIVDAMRKLNQNDYLGCGLALLGLIPAIGDSLSIIGKGVSKLGTQAASRIVGQRVLKELIEVLGKVIDGDLIDTFKEVVYSFAEDRKIKPDNMFANIKNALATFKGVLERSLGEEKDAKQAISHAAGITKKKM